VCAGAAAAVALAAFFIVCGAYAGNGGTLRPEVKISGGIVAAWKNVAPGKMSYGLDRNSRGFPKQPGRRIPCRQP